MCRGLEGLCARFSTDRIAACHDKEIGTDQDISDFPSEHVVKKQALQLREMARQQAKRGRWRRRVGNTARWQYSKFGYADNLAVSDYKPTHCDSDLSWKLLGDSEAGNAR